MDKSLYSRIDCIVGATHEERAKGLNCAESVLFGLSKYWRLDFPFSVATGFGGGVARSGGI